MSAFSENADAANFYAIASLTKVVATNTLASVACDEGLVSIDAHFSQKDLTSSVIHQGFRAPIVS